ncbi:MAG: hypothetical protein ABSG67_12435 [Thermoguttaceae bacterium]|jgi:hypothetical protein
MIENEPETKENKREWGKVVEGQAISIETNKTSYAPEERIVLTILYKNVGQKSVDTLFTGNIFATYDIKVFLPDGKETQITNFKKQVCGDSITPRFPGYVSTSLTKPGEEKSRGDIPLSRYFDFSCEGTYTIIVQQKLLQDGNDKETLKAISNKLKITIDNHLEQK